MFFFQFLVQAGVFFVVPLFSLCCTRASAIDTGVRLLPLSVALLVTAIGIPKLLPTISPRRVVQFGLLALLAGTLGLLGGIDPDAGPEIVSSRCSLIGPGTRLRIATGAVTVSAVPDEDSPEVVVAEHSHEPRRLARHRTGGVPSHCGIDELLLREHPSEPGHPAGRQGKATTELAGGVPFVSDADLEQALEETGASSPS